jgi:hypothetical protein
MRRTSFAETRAIANATTITTTDADQPGRETVALAYPFPFFLRHPFRIK